MKVVHPVSQRLGLLLHVKTPQLMLQLVQMFSMCMTMGLLMLNPLLSSHMHIGDDLDHGPVAMHTRSHAKQVQFLPLHISSASQCAQSTVDPIGVVPAYSSEIAGANSKDQVVLYLPKINVDFVPLHYLWSDVNSMKQL